MQWARACFWSACLAFVSGTAVPAADDFPFRSHDRVLFLGDSITEQYQYSTDVELYLATRFPEWKLSFLNAGISGDRAEGGLRRYQEQVLDEQPTVVTINFGMNDGGYGAFDEGKHKIYVDSTAKMLKMSKDAGVRVVLMSPNAVDPRIQERFNLYLETQKQFYAPLQDLAAAEGAWFVDQYAITRTILETLAQKDAKSVVPLYDGFHTAPSGGLLMAYAILTGLNAPAVVSEVTIPATGEPTTHHCAVTDLKRDGQSISFDRQDSALPLPIQPEWDTLLPYLNHLKDLNWYGVQAEGLAAGQYAISIDGVKISEVTADELAAGINLGNLRIGPVYEQAQKVFQAINQKNALVHQRFRGVILAPIPDWLADVAKERKPHELAKRKKTIDELQAVVQQLAFPTKRRWEIKPVP